MTTTEKQPTYVFLDGPTRAHLAPLLHYPHPTRGDGTLCGWYTVRPYHGTDTKGRICTACQERAGHVRA